MSSIYFFNISESPLFTLISELLTFEFPSRWHVMREIRKVPDCRLFKICGRFVQRVGVIRDMNNFHISTSSMTIYYWLKGLHCHWSYTPLVRHTIGPTIHGSSSGNKYFLMDKNVDKIFSTEFDSVGPCKNTHKTPSESSLGKASFSGKIRNGRH